MIEEGISVANLSRRISTDLDLIFSLHNLYSPQLLFLPVSVLLRFRDAYPIV